MDDMNIQERARLVRLGTDLERRRQANQDKRELLFWRMVSAVLAVIAAEPYLYMLLPA